MGGGCLPRRKAGPERGDGGEVSGVGQGRGRGGGCLPRRKASSTRDRAPRPSSAKWSATCRPASSLTPPPTRHTRTHAHAHAHARPPMITPGSLAHTEAAARRARARETREGVCAVVVWGRVIQRSLLRTHAHTYAHAHAHAKANAKAHARTNARARAHLVKTSQSPSVASSTKLCAPPQPHPLTTHSHPAPTHPTPTHSPPTTPAPLLPPRPREDPAAGRRVPGDSLGGRRTGTGRPSPSRCESGLCESDSLESTRSPSPPKRKNMFLVDIGQSVNKKEYTESSL